MAKKELSVEEKMALRKEEADKALLNSTSGIKSPDVVNTKPFKTETGRLLNELINQKKIERDIRLAELKKNIAENKRLVMEETPTIWRIGLIFFKDISSW